MTALHTTLLDVVALVGGGIAELDTPDDQIGQAVTAIVNDLQAADPDDVVTAFLGVTLALVERLAKRTGETPEEYWNHTAAGLSARLAGLENQA